MRSDKAESALRHIAKQYGAPTPHETIPTKTISLDKILKEQQRSERENGQPNRRSK